MRRRDFLVGASGGAAAALLPVKLPAMMGAFGAGAGDRGVKICVANDADPSVREAAASIAHATGHPLLQAMGATPEMADSRGLAKGDLHARAYNHLVIVGLMDDPLMMAAWQREARPIDGGMYIFGFGQLKGDIGYIESDRNPFLHSSAVQRAPFETEVVTITGSTPLGVQMAVEAFVRSSLVNGVVAGKGWTRGTKTLLDRDPLTPRFELPSIAPETMAGATRIGYTQATEDEYRGVLADTGVSPAEIWRAKYFEKGNWDGVGMETSFDNYAAGLHRRAYGNTLWMARFSSTSEAGKAATKIANAAKLKDSGGTWTGIQHPYANATYTGENKSAGTLSLTQKDVWVTMFAQQTRWVPGTPKGTKKVS